MWIHMCDLSNMNYRENFWMVKNDYEIKYDF